MPARPFKISCSVTDFSPLLQNLDIHFKNLKETGVDGVELVTGVKSRWSVGELERITDKYQLPITSMHQPIWSGIGLHLDKGFVALAKRLQVKKIVIHPLPFLAFDNKILRNYFERLSEYQNEFDVQLMLENIPKDFSIRIGKYKYPSRDDDFYNMENVLAVATDFGFQINYDTSHGKYIRPHKEPWFDKILPHLGNIHLSSFTETSEHLPLFMGDFKTDEFISYLYEKDYKGQITFEIFYPYKYMLGINLTYDYESIRKSVEIFKSIKPQ